MRLRNIAKTATIRIRMTLAVVVAAATVAGLSAATSRSAVAVANDADGVTVAVQGNQLVDGSGHPLRLVGVNRSGTEYACVQGWGIFDGPSDAQSVAAIAAWHVNAVRVPLNEDCWLGINGVAPAFGGDAYRTAVENYVHELNQAGMVAIVDLHWGAPDGQLATSQEMMPDQHATDFWQSVATTFESDHGVVFDLFDEPYGVSWPCWLDGCLTPAGYQAVGMQSLVDTVRATGAIQPIMVEPLDWETTCRDSWTTHRWIRTTSWWPAFICTTRRRAIPRAVGTARSPRWHPSIRSSPGNSVNSTARPTSSIRTWRGPMPMASATWGGRGTPAGVGPVARGHPSSRTMPATPPVSGSGSSPTWPRWPRSTPAGS